MKTEKAKTLSVRQPYASLILLGAKWSENRSWLCSYRGPLWIHASSWDADERDALKDLLNPGEQLVDLSEIGWPVGALIGRVYLVDIVPVAVLNALRKKRKRPDANGDLWEMIRQAPPESWEHVEGPYCWILTDPEPLAQPIPYSGKLNLWTAEVPEKPKFLEAVGA